MYIDAIKPEERAETELTERRIVICAQCDKLSDATCLACGCYVEFRASHKKTRCPKGKW